MITLKPNDLHPGSGTLTDLFNKPGVALSVRNLMELMLLISDNSAADVLLRLAGGPQEVSGRMRALGIEGIRVDRSTAQLIADWGGVMGLPPESEWTPELFRRLLSAVPEEKRRAAALRADEDPRDTSTPEAMALVLARIHRKDLLEKESAEMLLDIMLRCRTGETRLKGILPAGTSVAHNCHAARQCGSCRNRRVCEILDAGSLHAGAHHRRDCPRRARFLPFSACLSGRFEQNNPMRNRKTWRRISRLNFFAGPDPLIFRCSQNLVDPVIRQTDSVIVQKKSRVDLVDPRGDKETGPVSPLDCQTTLSP